MELLVGAEEDILVTQLIHRHPSLTPDNSVYPANLKMCVICYI